MLFAFEFSNILLILQQKSRKQPAKILKDHVEDTEGIKLEELGAVKGPETDDTNQVFNQPLILRYKFIKSVSVFI